MKTDDVSQVKYEYYGKNLARQALRIHYNLHDSYKGNEKAELTTCSTQSN